MKNDRAGNGRNLAGKVERTPSSFKRETERRLRAYVLAASSAGVGLLAFAQPASGQVVYTKFDIELTNGPLFFDLDCGPQVQFWLANRLEHTSFGLGDRIRELEVNGSMNASVLVDSRGPVQLASGSVIGSSRVFHNLYRHEEVMAEAYWEQYYGTYTGFAGPWANGKPAYLGLKFNIQGQTHYGWAQVRVTGTVQQITPLVKATVTGYAYESTPNMSLKAGQTRGLDPGTLGALAQGACQDPDSPSTLKLHGR